jgi:hypothetical protein
MSVELHEEAGGKILNVTSSGKLTTEDHAKFIPEVERAVESHGKVRMLIRMHDFHGPSMGAGWEDLKFDAHHFADVEWLALVGENRWEAGMSVFRTPFTEADIRYVDEKKADTATAWIHDGLRG